MRGQREYQYGQVMRSLLGVLTLAVWLLGAVAPVNAETMTCRTAGWVKVQERVPVGDVEDHELGVTFRVGMAFFDNGEIANFTAVSSWNSPPTSTEALGYAVWNFVDGSTIVTKFQQSNVSSTDPNYGSDGQATGEILSGTGRFAGITGSVSFTAKNLKRIKGEPGGRSTTEQTFTYTLPAK
ncbi:MAG: hypothetical protein ACHQ7N_03850 [Candidatus Methylomirabilales bacterium]